MVSPKRYPVIFLSGICLFFWAVPSPAQEIGQSYALFFAGNTYDHYRKLTQPIANAEAIAQELKDHYGFKTEIIRNPTLEDMEKALERYEKNFENGTYDHTGQLLLYFTGHGMVENRNGYFLPRNGRPERLYRTALGYNYWREEINSFNCKHILVVLDACFSGTFDPKWYSRSGIQGKRPGEYGPAAKILANHQRYKSRIFFTSAEENEVSDRSDFAREFLTGLRSRTEAHQDGILTSSELWLRISTLLNKTHQGHFGDHEGDANFLFLLQSIPAVQGTDPQALARRRGDLDAFDRAEKQNTIAAYTAYLKDYPYGEFSAEARTRIRELQEQQAREAEDLEWKIARRKDTPEAYGYYLSLYPRGRYATDARNRRDNPTPQPATTKSPTTAFTTGYVDEHDMVFIKGGTFQMGDQFGEGDGDEKPVHKVTVDDFWLGQHEVTFDEYDAYCRAVGKKAPQDRGWGRGKRPVIYVSWYDAIEYCNWRSGREGLEAVYRIDKNRKDPNNQNSWDNLKWTVSWNPGANGYRLPTEAEWEYAARERGRKVRFGNGQDIADANEINFNAKEDYKKPYSRAGKHVGKTMPYGSYKASAIGLFDMSGNVREWCWDWYGKDYYSQSSNARDPKGPSSGAYRVVRGGSWSSYPFDCRAAYRSWLRPYFRNYFNGFRLARN